MAPTLNENIESPAQASISDAIIMSTPGELQDIIRDDYIEDIAKLPIDKQRAILEEWKKQDPKNIGIFNTIFIRGKEEVVKTKEEIVKTKEEIVKTKEEIVKTKEEIVDSQQNKLSDVSKAAKEVNDFAEKIKKATGNKYDAEIQSELKSDREKPETKQFLSTLGIDIEKNPTDIQSDAVQKILMARASTQVYLRHREEIGQDPSLKVALENIYSLQSKIGLSSSSKNIGDLLTDQPKSDREAITSTVKSLTKDSPDTMITRTGDRLTFQDPKNERYTYDIDMAKRPIELSKQLGGLTISRELGETRDPAREENKKTRDNVDRLVTGINLKKNEILNGTLKDGTKIISEGFSESEGFGGSIKNTLSQIKLGTVEAAGTSQIMIEAGLVSINSEKKRLEQLIKDKTGKDNLNSDLDSDIGAIRGTLRGIDTMIESFNKLKDECKKIQKEDPKNDHTQWENNTNRTLRDLVSLGFDELGQKNLNTLIKTISEQNGNRGIWEGGKLDITGKKLDQQLVYLEKFVGNLREKSGKNERETFQELRVRIASFADFRKDRWESGTFIAGFLPNKDNNNSTVTAQNTSGESMKKPL